MIKAFARIVAHLWQMVMSVLMVVGIAFLQLDLYDYQQNPDHR